MKLKVLDLFAGLHGWSEPFIDRSHEVVTLDIEPRFNCTITGDVRKVSVDELTDAVSGGRYDIIVASPPCESFSVAALSKNWSAIEPCRECGEFAIFDAKARKFLVHDDPSKNYDHDPVSVLSANPTIRAKNERAALGQELVERTIEIIEELQPDAFVIENPRGMLRRLPIMSQFELRTVTWCQYGDTVMKPTDLWGGFPETLKLRPPCKNGDPCHEAAPRGSRTGTQGKKDAAERAKIPYKLGLAVCIAMERKLMKMGRD